jgi:hypothetical protein
MHRFKLTSAVALTLTLTAVSHLPADITPVNYPLSLSNVGSVSGDIMNIDPVNKMIQVRDVNGIVQTIRVDDHVQILRRGETVHLHDLSLGDFVTVSEK